MTRDEALAKAKIAMNHPGVIWCSNMAEANAAIAKIERDAEHFVDASVALGMLKLDEPKSENFAIHKLVNACRGVPYLATTIQETIDAAGLKIVEK